MHEYNYVIPRHFGSMVECGAGRAVVVAGIVHRDVVDFEPSSVRVNRSIQALLTNLRIVVDAND